MGGGNVSRAEVRSDYPSPQLGLAGTAPVRRHLHVRGGQGGGGFELRLSSRVALDLDALGFIRNRIDSGDGPGAGVHRPEHGQDHQPSAGALFRGGLNLLVVVVGAVS